MAPETKNERQSGLSEPLKPAEPPEEVLMPDISVENDPGPELSLNDHPSVTDEVEGFNPYDTAVLYKG